MATQIGAMRIETAESLDEYERGSAEQRDAAMRLLMQASDTAAMCAVSMEYVRRHVAGEGDADDDFALSVASAAELLAYTAYEDSCAALSALGE